MIIMKCDICGEETDINYVKDELRLRFIQSSQKDTISTSDNDEWKVIITVLKNGGHPAEICKKCLLRIINETGEEIT